MNIIINTLVFLFCFHVSVVQLLVSSGDFESGDNERQLMPSPITAVVNNDYGNKMNSTAYMTVNHFYCGVEEIEDQIMILYGTKSWTFPIQDVNLTLSYPSAKSESEFSAEDETYLITAFKVILHIDGMETKGYITNGGVMKMSIALTFVSRNITSLSYQFWLYGAPKNSTGPHTELHSRYFMC